MGKKRSKGRSSNEGTPMHSDSSDGEDTNAKRNKITKKGPRTSAEICEDIGLEDVELEFTEADYQNLTTFSLFSRLFRPQIIAANARASSAKIIQVMEAKWREFGKAKVAADKRRKEAEEAAKAKREEEAMEEEAEQEEEQEEEEQDDKDEDEDEELVQEDEEEEEEVSKKKSKSPRRSTGTLRIKMPMIALRKSNRDRKQKNYNEDGSDSTASSVPVAKKRRKHQSDEDSDSSGYSRRRSGRARKVKRYSEDEESDDSSFQKSSKKRSSSGGKAKSAKSRTIKKKKVESEDDYEDDVGSSRNITATEEEDSDDFMQVSDQSSDDDDDLSSDDEGRHKSRKKRRSDERPQIPGERKSERRRKSLSKIVSDREFERLMREDELEKKKKKEDEKKRRERAERKKQREMEKMKKGYWQEKQDKQNKQNAAKKEGEEDDGNESDHFWFCEVCKDGGDLLLCDTCPKSFHKECLKMDDVPEGDWSCPLCTGEGLPEEGDSEVEHEQFCRVCRDGGDVILCDFCPDVYHMKCVNPPLKEVPEGDWKCERCVMADNAPKAKIKQILTWRWSHQLKGTDELDHTHSPQKQVRSGNSKELEARPTRELFVRYEYHSYWDCEWISELQLEIHQVSKWHHFKRKFDRDEPPALEDGSSYGKVRHKEHSKDPYRLDETYYRYNVKPEWLQIQRIIAHEGKGRDTKYLVKWRDLSYEDCTWEYPGEVHKALEDELRRHIDIYWDRRKDKMSERKRKEKPPKKSALKTKFEKDPPFIEQCGGRLHPYQLEGLNWLRFSYSQNTNTILADEMGLGKTIQTIAFLYCLWKEGYSPGPFLITAPLSTVPNWEREFEFWAPELYVVTYIGMRDGRMVIRERDFCYKDGAFPIIVKPSKMREGYKPKFDVLLTSYENVNIDKTTLASIDWSVLVIDEAHRLKNNQSLFFQTMSDYKIQYKLLLTGTPLQNNLEELFNLLSFLEPFKFSSQDDFLKEFDSVSKELQVERLHNLLAPHMLRRLKSDVLSDMPAKTELIVRVELAPLQKTFYKHILTKNYEALNMKGASNQTSLMNIMMDLRKCCNHPYLFPTASYDAPLTRNGSYEGTALTKACGKLILLDKMLRVLKRDGHRVLIFSQMTKVIDLLEEFLEHLGHQYERIDGNVASNKRQEAIDRFNAPDSPQFVFLLSTKAGGLGINLATADTVIIYDMDWNPHNDIQAFSRAHRIGQKNKVMIYRFVARNTVEEKMTQVCKQKMMLTELIIHRGMGAEKKESLSKQEVSDILKYGAEELFKDNDDKAITYDEAAVEKLLDRSQESTATKELGLNDYLKSFRVASYQVKTTEAEEEEVEEEPAPQPSTSSNTEDTEYWKKVLGESYQEFTEQQIREQEEIAKTLGKGKRLRRRINYAEQQAALEIESARKKKEAVIEDAMYMSEYEPTSSSESEHEDSEEGDASKELESIGVKKPLRQQGRPKKVEEKKKELPPLMAKVNGHVEVLGFTARQRRAFLDVVMKFGLPPDDSFNSQWKVRDLRDKTEKVFKAYASLFLRHLCEPIADENSDVFSDGIPREGLSRQHVLTRVGMIALIRKKVAEFEKINGIDSMEEFDVGLRPVSAFRRGILAKPAGVKNPEAEELLRLLEERKAEKDGDKTEKGTEKEAKGTDKDNKETKEEQNKGTANGEVAEANKDKTEEKREQRTGTDDSNKAEKGTENGQEKQDNGEKEGEAEQKPTETEDKPSDDTKIGNDVEQKKTDEETDIKSEHKEDVTEDSKEGDKQLKEGDGKEVELEKQAENSKCVDSDDKSSKIAPEVTEKGAGDSSSQEMDKSMEACPGEKAEAKEMEGASKQDKDEAEVKNEKMEEKKDDDVEMKEVSKEVGKEKGDGDVEMKDAGAAAAATENGAKGDTSCAEVKEDKTDKETTSGDTEKKMKNKKDADKSSPKPASKPAFVHKTYQELTHDLRQKFWIADGGFTELHALWQLEESTMDQHKAYQTWHRRHDFWLLTGIVTHGYRHWQDILNDARFEILNHVFRTDEARMKKAAFLNRRFQVLEQALVIEEQLRKAAKRNHGIASVQEAQDKNDQLTALDKMASHLRKVNQAKEKGSVDKRSVKALNQVAGLVQDIKQCTFANCPASLVKPPPGSLPQAGASTTHGAKTVAAALNRPKPQPQKYVSQMLADKSKPKGRDVITLD